MNGILGGLSSTSWKPRSREADVSAQQPQAEEDTWVSLANEDPRRPADPGQAAGQRPRRALGLIARAGPSLLRSADFRSALERGARAAETRVLVYVRPSGQDTRAGFVCARHVGGAVVRNRARRILREAWRAIAHGVQPGFDIVLVARPGIRGAKTNDLMAEMVAALSSLGAMKP